MLIHKRENHPVALVYILLKSYAHSTSPWRSWRHGG